MALQVVANCSGLVASEAYVRPEIFSRSGPTREDGSKKYQATIKVYANKAQSEVGGAGAFHSFNCVFVQEVGDTIESACYTALKLMKDMEDAVDC